jgi:hypothetical protein
MLLYIWYAKYANISGIANFLFIINPDQLGTGPPRMTYTRVEYHGNQKHTRNIIVSRSEINFYQMNQIQLFVEYCFICLSAQNLSWPHTIKVICGIC